MENTVIAASPLDIPVMPADEELAKLKAEVAALRAMIFTSGDRSMTMEGRAFTVMENGFIGDNNFDFDAGMRVTGDFVGDEKQQYAKWLEWCFFIVTELDSTSLYVMRRHSANALGPIYGVAPEVVAKAGEYFREQLRHVEVALDDGRTFLMGDQFTSADILLTTCLEWAIAYGVGICDNAHPYLERIKKRPGYVRGTAANVPPAPGEPVRRPA